MGCPNTRWGLYFPLTDGSNRRTWQVDWAVHQLEIRNVACLDNLGSQQNRALNVCGSSIEGTKRERLS